MLQPPSGSSIQLNSCGGGGGLRAFCRVKTALHAFVRVRVRVRVRCTLRVRVRVRVCVCKCTCVRLRVHMYFGRA